MSSTVTLHFETEFSSHRFERGLALLLVFIALLYSALYLRYMPATSLKSSSTVTVSIKKTSPVIETVVEEVEVEVLEQITVQEKKVEQPKIAEYKVPRDNSVVIQSQSQEIKSTTTFNSTLLLEEIIESREVPSLQGEFNRSDSSIFDARFESDLNKSAMARAGRGNKKPAVEEYKSQFGEHTIRSGNLCAVDNTTMAGIMEVDSMYFVGECGTKRNAIEFSYSPEKDGYLPP